MVSGAYFLYGGQPAFLTLRLVMLTLRCSSVRDHCCQYIPFPVRLLTRSALSYLDLFVVQDHGMVRVCWLPRPHHYVALEQLHGQARGADPERRQQRAR